MITTNLYLPPEVWNHIFNFVGKIPSKNYKVIKLVCREWHALATQSLDLYCRGSDFRFNCLLKPRLRKIDFCSFTTDMLVSVLTDIETLRELHLGSSDTVNNQELKEYVSDFNGLSRLTYFGMSYLNQKILKLIAEKATSLQELSCGDYNYQFYRKLRCLSTLTNLTYLYVTVEKTSLGHLPSLPKLTTLKLSLSGRPTAFDLTPLFKWTQLRKLFIVNQSVDGEILHKLSLALPRLKKLQISALDDFSNWQSKEELVQVCSRFPDLRDQVACGLFNLADHTYYFPEQWLTKWHWMIEGVVESGADLNFRGRYTWPLWFHITSVLGRGIRAMTLEKYFTILEILLPYVNVQAKDTHGFNILSYIKSLAKNRIISSEWYDALTSYFLGKGVIDEPLGFPSEF